MRKEIEGLIEKYRAAQGFQETVERHSAAEALSGATWFGTPASVQQHMEHSLMLKEFVCDLQRLYIKLIEDD